MKLGNPFEKYPRNRISLGIFLILALVTTLFPPFEWNCAASIDRTGIEYIGEVVIINQSTAIKSYQFLFGFNQKQFYSDLTKRNETFTRSLILSELLVEYLLIGFIATLLHLVLFKIDKKRL